MGKHRAEPYSNGDVSLGRSGGWWVAGWRDGVHPRKRKRLIPESRPQAEAQIALDRFAEARRAVVVVQRSFTVGGLWELWLADRAKDGLSNRVYAAQWTALAPYFASRAPHLLVRDDGREYAKFRFGRGMAPATVHSEILRVRSCLNWAVDNNLIPKPQKLWAPSPGGGRKLVLTPAEAYQLVTVARESCPHHIFLFIVLAFSTGGRHTALLDLTWDRIDFAKGTINLEIDLPRDPMSKVRRKGRADVVMSNLARTALLDAYEDRTCKSNHVIEYGGNRIASVKNGFAHAVARADLNPKITPHTIRHTVATWASESDIDVKHTAHLLGHHDERTTKLIYTHNSAEASRPAVEVIDTTFSALPTLSESATPRNPKSVAKRRLLSNIDKTRPPVGKDK